MPARFPPHLCPQIKPVFYSLLSVRKRQGSTCQQAQTERSGFLSGSHRSVLPSPMTESGPLTPQLPPGRHLSIDGTLCLLPSPQVHPPSLGSLERLRWGEAELPSRRWNGVGGERGASTCGCVADLLGVREARIHLPVQGTPVRSLAREYHTCCRATKPMCRRHLSPCSRAREPQLLKPTRPRARAPSKRSH